MVVVMVVCSRFRHSAFPQKVETERERKHLKRSTGDKDDTA